MMTRFVSLSCAVALYTSVASAAVLDTQVNPANGHTYHLIDGITAWDDAEAEAVTLGGHLVTVNSAGEQDFLVDKFLNFGGTPRSLWIGFTDQDVEGDFAWISGQPVGYTNWGSTEPNDLGSGEDYGYITALTFHSIGPGDWNDVELDTEGLNDEVSHAVVEIPEPATLALLALGVLLVPRRR